MRWYVSHPSLAGLPCASVDRVIGRNVDLWLRTDAAGGTDPRLRLLRRLQNEVQMLLFTHPINEQREDRGVLPVNSFWLSGCGPAQPVDARRSACRWRTGLRAAALTGDWAAWVGGLARARRRPGGGGRAAPAPWRAGAPQPVRRTLGTGLRARHWRLAGEAARPLPAAGRDRAAGVAVSLPGRPKGEYRSAQHEGSPGRPGDDWLLRAGRLRVPTGLYSESMDVGVTHDMARLPSELYAMFPTTDIDGVYATRSWTLGSGGERELSTDAYTGSSDAAQRYWSRDGIGLPGAMAGANFIDVRIRTSGMVLTLREPGLLLRGSAHHARVWSDKGTFPVSYPYVALAPGVGYFQMSNAMPGPGVVTADSISNTIYTLGAEWSPGSDWRMAGEYMRIRQHGTEFAFDATGWYLAVFRRFGRLTPYVSVSGLGTRSSALDWYDRLSQTRLPLYMPGAAQINAMHRLGAEAIVAADQRSLALGASYALTPTLKLKGEWLRTRIGRMSHLVDTPPGSESPHNTPIDVLSVNLNFTF